MSLWRVWKKLFSSVNNDFFSPHLLEGDLRDSLK
jgi:hypothetical protein